MFVNAAGHVVRALTVAGSDSGGGAGIQADLKTFAAFDVYGMSVVTALTAQNTLGVQGVHYVEPAFVAQQLASVFDDFGSDAVKTGMLGSSEIIRTVATALRGRRARQIVVDPVMVAKGGQALIDEDAVLELKTSLLPLALVTTPNIPEAEALTGQPIVSWADCHRAAREIAESGVQAVIVKGGHAQSAWNDDVDWDAGLTQQMAVDVVYSDGRFTYFASPRIDTIKTHGTGCTYSSAIAAGLARGRSLLQAVADAKAFISDAIASAATWNVGHGHGPTDHGVQRTTANFDIVPNRLYCYVAEKWTQTACVQA